MEEKFVAIIDVDSNEEKTYYKAWKRSNGLSLMFMRMTAIDNIKTTLSKIESAKNVWD